MATMIQNDISPFLQARVDRLLNNADRLFALGNIREHCQTAIKMFHEDMQPSPFTPWGTMLRDNREYRFALSLTLTYTSTKDEIIQLVRGCQEEYLLQEVEEERERQIEDFARMKIASRWYQMKDDDHAWRVFSQNIPYGETGREEDIRQFFETLDRICILTDILMGHAAEYGLNVEYEHMAEGDWKQQEEKEAEELEKEFADFEEVVDETAENNNAPKVKVKPDLPPADVFVNRVKAIVLEMAKKNGETIKTNTRAWQGEYVFFVDGKRIAKMMDDLRKNHENKINEFISTSSKYDGVMIVAPFIGKLLQIEELRARDLQFTDLEFAFTPYYNKPSSAVKRMSDKLDSTEANMLFGLLRGLLKKYPVTESA
jgi:hypothetical protein